jgi:hypothetical protein
VQYVADHFKSVFHSMIDNKWKHFDLYKMPSSGIFQDYCNEHMKDPRKLRQAVVRKRGRHAFWQNSSRYWREGKEIWRKELQYQVDEIKRLLNVTYCSHVNH